MLLQLDVELQKYVSLPADPTAYETDAPGVSDTFEIAEYAPPPPPPPPGPEPPLAPPPPPPMTSIVLLDEFQSLGTVQLVPEVRKMTVEARAGRGRVRSVRERKRAQRKSRRAVKGYR